MDEVTNNQGISLVSVIMIFLNAEEYIEEAIESVLAQSYSNWELILVDDGSADSSTDIARQYVADFPEKIFYVEHRGHRNRGMSASRNLGIRNSHGDLIAFLDADDVYLPRKLERQVHLMRERPEVEMVYGNTEYWYSWTGRPEDLKLDRMRRQGIPAEQLYRPPVLLIGFLRDTVRTPATCGVLVRKEVIEKVGGFEERFSGIFEDQVFFYKVCLFSSVYIDSECCARYRQHPSSWCQINLQTGEWSRQGWNNPARIKFYRWLEAYLQQQPVTKASLRKELQRATFPYRHPTIFRLTSLFDRFNMGAIRLAIGRLATKFLNRSRVRNGG